MKNLVKARLAKIHPMVPISYRIFRKRGPISSFSYLINSTKAMLECKFNPNCLKLSNLPLSNPEKIKIEMENDGLKVKLYNINLDGFNAFIEEVNFPNEYKNSFGRRFPEKALEHYVGAQLLNLKKNDVFIDIAAATSPWFKIVRDMYNVNSYALDLEYPEGINGSYIGADATKMPLKSNSVDKISLHCAYEMFEGKADKKLIPEVERVLKNGGKMVILPLYMHQMFYADTCPYSDTNGLNYDGATRVWRDDGSSVRFSRKYSVKAFIERVVNQMKSLDLTVYYITNEKKIDKICYLKFAALFEKKS